MAIYGVHYYGEDFYGADEPRQGQEYLNSLLVEFDVEPQHLDPNDAGDALNPDNYVIVGPTTPFPDRLLQSITHVEDGFIRLWFDGPLVRDEQYTVTVSNVVSKAGGVPLTPLTVPVELVAFGPDRPVQPEQLKDIDVRDVANPQLSRDSKGHSLGTYSANESGDLEFDTRRSSLRKRVLRRCTTGLGGFAHLESYGLKPQSKKLFKPADLRRLQSDAEAQVALEPDVVSVRAIVSQQDGPGIVRLKLQVEDKYGTVEIETTLGGE